MGVRVFYSEISGSKEVKKRQQRVMMILESKSIPFEAIDITEPGKEKEKDFMLANAKPRGDSKIILAPQIFNDDRYCGDYEDFDLANENDNLEEFLGSPKMENNIQVTEKAAEVVENGKPGSREPSAEVEAKSAEATNGAGSTDEPENNTASEPQTEETTAETTTTEATPSEENPPEEKQSEEAADDTSAQEPSSKTAEEAEGDGADE